VLAVRQDDLPFLVTFTATCTCTKSSHAPRQALVPCGSAIRWIILRALCRPGGELVDIIMARERRRDAIKMVLRLSYKFLPARPRRRRRRRLLRRWRPSTSAPVTLRRSTTGVGFARQ